MQNRIRNKKNLPAGRSQSSWQEPVISADGQQFFSRHYISSGVSRPVHPAAHLSISASS
jgi:hypothetical protein